MFVKTPFALQSVSSWMIWKNAVMNRLTLGSSQLSIVDTKQKLISSYSLEMEQISKENESKVTKICFARVNYLQSSAFIFHSNFSLSINLTKNRLAIA